MGLTPYALKFVRFSAIEDHFRAGWAASFPNAPMHHHHYGIELAWLCDCPVPGGFQVEDSIQSTTERSDLGLRSPIYGEG